MNVLILFWLNGDNFTDVIPDIYESEDERKTAVKKWEQEHGYNPETIIYRQHYMIMEQ